MSGKTIVLQLGADNEKPLNLDDLSNIAQNQETALDGPLYYVARNSTDEIVGTVQYTYQDRKAVGFLIAGWLTSGLIVRDRSQKEFIKDLREQQKAKEAAELPLIVGQTSAPVAATTMAPAATTVQAVPAAPAKVEEVSTVLEEQPDF
jgi:hypothetical protein